MLAPHSGWGEFPRYVSVGERRGNGARHAALLKKQGAGSIGHGALLLG